MNELATAAECEKCGTNKVCVSYQCCPHPIDWYWYRGQSSVTCRMCGGTVENPDFEKGQGSWMHRFRTLEASNKEMEEKVRKAKDCLSHVENFGYGDDEIAMVKAALASLQ